MVAHVEIFNIDPNKKELFREGMNWILDYYKRKLPEAKKTLFIPLVDYEDITGAESPPNRWIVVETFDSEATMKKCREDKFADSEWDERFKKAREQGVVPTEFTHSFCEVIE